MGGAGYYCETNSGFLTGLRRAHCTSTRSCCGHSQYSGQTTLPQPSALLFPRTPCTRTCYQPQANPRTWFWKLRFDDATKETAYDGLTVLFLILQHLHLDTMVDVFKELAAIQNLHIKDFGNIRNNFTEYLSAMEAKQISIDRKDRTSYPVGQSIMHLFNGMLQSKCISLHTQSMKQKCLTPEPLIADATTMYVNMNEDGTWNGEYD